MTDSTHEVERSRAAMPSDTRAILDRRDLASGNPFLAQRLRPGMAVLDIGCGTGAITRGIAELVGFGGETIGLDTNQEFIQRARASENLPGLSFLVGDAYDLPFENRFDVVTAARVLQWLARPLGGCFGLQPQAHRLGSNTAAESVALLRGLPGLEGGRGL